MRYRPPSGRRHKNNVRVRCWMTAPANHESRMSFFLIFLAALIALALLFLLPPLLRRHGEARPEHGAVDARRANLQVLREQLAALDAELAAGLLEAEQHRLARIEIERRALEEEQHGERPAVAARAGKTAVVVGVFIPVFVLLVYAALGTPQALLPAAGMVAAGNPEGEVTQEQIVAIVDKLAQRMQSKTTVEQGDLQGWTMLARSYSLLQRYPEASRAFARARALAPDDAQLLADHADVLAMVQGQSVLGEPLQLVERALKIDPKNLKALALAGSAAFERKDFAGALNNWGQAQQAAPPGSEFASGLESSMQQARTAMAGGGPAAVAATPTAAQSAAAAPAGAADPKIASAAPRSGQTSGVVQLAGALAGKVAATDTVYIFARAAQGPRMPLAILKRRAGELPISFTLDDSTAMSPEMKLSNFPSVVVGARISRSGDATPKSGDLTGQVGPVETGAGKLVITIDTIQP